MMDRHIRLIIMLLLVNTVITAIYLLLGYIRKTENVQGRWMKAVVMLLCPVIGPAFLFFSYWICRIFFRNHCPGASENGPFGDLFFCL